MKNVFSYVMIILVFTMSAVFMTGCKDDDYYEKPSWVGEPIYQFLEEQGGFTNYLACVDKTGYAQVLKGSGFYTAFVPNDEAFKKFMNEQGINSVDEISKELADKIVSYSLIPVASRADELDDYQRSVSHEDKETNLNIAYKRSTLNYKGVYSYETYGGASFDVLDGNVLGGSYLLEDKNLKSVSFFTDAFFQTKELSNSEYSYFYPDVEFSGLNVADAIVLQKDLRAENGIIHVVDKVILPLPNLEEILAESGENSDFKNILEEYMVELTLAPREISLREEQNTGVYKNIYIKAYPSLSIAPNSENYLIEGNRTGNQVNGWTMFAPTNEALATYFQEVFLAKGYQSLEEMPKFVIEEFVNAHMFTTTVWPSKFASTQNDFGEPARFDKDLDVGKRKIGSNGIFYSVNKVQATDAFITVLADILLDPNYTMMYRALVATDNQFQLRNTIARQQIFLISNAQFNDLGISYSATDNKWEITKPEWENLSETSVLDRILNLHIIFHADKNKPFEDLSTGFGLVKTNNEEYIRYFNGRIWASGQTISSASQLVAANDTLTNGLTYELNKPLIFTTDNIGAFLETNPNYRNFYRYLEKSANSTSEGAEDPNEKSRVNYDPDTKIITDISRADDQTYLIPNNAAITQAVTDGLLPPITAASFSQEEQEMVKRFVQFHILRRQIIYPNGGYNNIAYTNYKDNDGDTYVSIDSNTTNKLIIYDRKGREAVVTATGTSAHTNVVANRAVIHLLDNYLDYRIEP